MSDKLSTVSTTLSSMDTNIKVMNNTIRMLLVLLVLLLLIVPFTWYSFTVIEPTVTYIPVEMVLTSDNGIEEFKNDNNEGQSEFNSNVPRNIYMTANLTSPLLSKNATQNMLFGQGKKFVSKDKAIIDIYANLPILDGNVYSNKDLKAPTQQYEVRLYDIRGPTAINVPLKRDGDGLYKVQYTISNILTAESLNAIEIMHVTDGNNKVILQGSFI